MSGDDAAIAQLFQLALGQDVAGAAGRAVRRMATRACLERARSLRAEAEQAGGEDGERLRRRALRCFALAIVAKDARRATARPRRRRFRSQPAAVSLLDPAPSPPRSVVASHSIATVSNIDVLFVAPASDFGHPVNNYTATASPFGIGVLKTKSFGTSTSGQIDNVIAGTYDVTVTATNSDGTSVASLPANRVVIGGAIPGAPSISGWAAVGNTLTGTWNAVAGATEYVTTLYDGALNRIDAHALRRTALTTQIYPPLPNGSYTLGVRAIGPGGFGNETRSAVAVVNLDPGSLEQIKPLFAPFPSDPLLIFDLPAGIAPAGVQKRLAGALATGSKWRYEHLKAQVLRAVQDAQQFESFIAQLMQLAATKLETAQLLASPVFQQVITTIQQDTQELQELAASTEVATLVDRLAKEASTVMLLQAVLTFLIENEPVRFWIGLFDRMIRDIASFSGSLPRTRTFIDGAFSGPIGDAVKALADQLRTQAAAQVDAMAEPLRSAVKDIVQETSAALETVYASFDMPLLMRPAGEGLPDVPNVGPFTDVLGDLTNAVESLVNSIKSDIDGALAGVSGGDSTLFRVVMITYICLPILAFVAIGAAGGPFSAAAFAAIVLLAIEELVHLLARWLAGPLLDRLNDAKERVLGIVRELQDVFGRQALLLDNPAANLQLLAGQLLEVKDAIPAAFLNDAATLVAEVRRGLMNASTELALAAERALGMENATAFDVIRPDYETRLTGAPQLPGGSDPTRLAGARLIRDFNQLEIQRTKILDGKEMEVTYRLSLFRLLGGVGDPALAPVTSGFSQFLNAKQLLLNVLEEDLIDRNFPGLYRALLKEVRVTGLFSVPTPANQTLPAGVPFTITHLGQSRTRIKRNSNPFAPPFQMPGCLPTSADAFTTRVFHPNDPDHPEHDIEAIIDAAITKAVNDFRYQVARRVIFRFRLTGELIRDQVRRSLRQELSAAVAERVFDASCGAIPTDRARKVVTRLANLMAVETPESRLISRFFPTKFDPPRAQVAAYLQSLDIGAQIIFVLQPVLVAQFEAVARELQSHVAKWAGSTLEEDRDPQIRSLGFATLVQNLPVETAVYNLLPDAGTLTGRLSQPSVTTAAQPPVTATDTLQYRPFENRGAQGKLLLGINSTPSTPLPVDVLLDITVRGCFDEDLAAAVRVSRAQEITQFGLANAIAGGPGRTLIEPGSIAELITDSTDVRTVHFSARAHRDKLLRYAKAAADAVNTPGSAGGLIFDANETPLASHTGTGAVQPLRWLAAAAPQHTLTLKFQQNPPTSFGQLDTTLFVTPVDLGIPTSLQQGGSIVSLGIAIIPMEEAAAFVSLNVDSPLAGLLPAIAPTPDTRLIMRDDPTPVSWSSILAAGSPGLALNLGAAIRNGQIFDVIFSVSVSLPVFASRTNAL